MFANLDGNSIPVAATVVTTVAATVQAATLADEGGFKPFGVLTVAASGAVHLSCAIFRAFFVD